MLTIPLDLQVHDIFNSYLRDNYWTSRTGEARSSFDLNVAAARVVLDIVPGLEASVIMETDGLVKRLYSWVEKAEQPLQVPTRSIGSMRFRR